MGWTQQCTLESAPIVAKGMPRTGDQTNDQILEGTFAVQRGEDEHS